MSKNQLVKDLPLYINGFVVTYLFMGTKCNIIDIVMFGLAILSFIWYGINKKQQPKTLYYE